MSIENPRQEAGEPRVPEIRWIPNIGAYAKVGGAWYSLEVDMSRPLTLPSDAVKLGDVEPLRAAVLAVLDSEWPDDEAWEDDADRRLKEIRAIVEGENR